MRIAFHTLGCKVNQYETEAMAEIFRSRGHEIVGEDDFADVYVVNTCTVTSMADRKSRQFIRRMKKVNPNSIIAVTGCYVQIDPEAVKQIEGVDIITGINEKATLPGYVEDLANRRAVPKGAGAIRDKAESAAAVAIRDKAEPAGAGAIRDKAESAAAGLTEIETDDIHLLKYEDLGAYENMGKVTSAEGRTRAYIKVEDGCNRFCSYCVIPYARGPVRSRPIEQIVEEAKELIEAGYREIVITGINTALYDGENAGTQNVCSHDDALYGIERVIAALNDLDGDFRIRLSSLEPTVVDAEYVKRLLKYDRLCHHMHLSAQSGSNRVLDAMNRSYNRSDYKKIVKTLRDFDPCYGISTDIIVGFPGEDESDFRDSVELVENCCFCRTHIFKYSSRPLTKAREMQGQIASGDKAERSERLQNHAEQAASRFFEMNIGSRRRVLVEEFLADEEMVCGYTDNYIKVYVKAKEDEARELINSFVDITLDELFRDGMTGTMSNKSISDL